MALITDVDIVKFDPEVYLIESAVVVKRCGGANGLVAGTQFTAAGVDFTASQITAGMVIYLASVDNVIKGVYEIVQILDSGHLLVSQLRNSATDPAIPIGSASGLTWSIKTLVSLFAQAELELSCRLGLKPGKPDAEYALSELQNIEVMKRVLTALLMARVFGAMYTSSAVADVRTVYEKKRIWYTRQAERMLSAVSLQLPASS